MNIFVLLVKFKVSGFAADFLCLVNVTVIGRCNKGHPLNWLEMMISDEMKKNRKQPIVIWLGT